MSAPLTKGEVLKHSLVENAIDFLALGVYELSEGQPTPQKVKYGLLHTAIAVELFFKKRLFDEHWSLIFAELKKADRANLEAADFQSVQLDECILRLSKICGIDLVQYKDILDKLKKLRNQIVHFEFTIERDAAISLLVKTWSMLQDFVKAHVDLTDIEKGEGYFGGICQGMRIHNEFCLQRETEIAHRLKELTDKGTVILGCPRCLSQSLPLTGEDTQCLFCLHTFQKDELRDEWLITFIGWHVLEISKEEMTEPHVRRCPECGNESLCHRGDSFSTRGQADWTCFNCTKQWAAHELDNCNYCDELYEHHGHELHECPDCYNSRMEMDNT